MTENINWWLMKSEPSTYSITDLQKEVTTLWDGIRNYQARNFMRSMKIGDKSFFYHSNCKSPAIVGLMEVIEINIKDPTQFDKNSKYYDEKSSENNPRWDCAKMRFLGVYSRELSLQQLRAKYTPEEIKVVKKGNRLSILPVPIKTAANLILRLGDFI